jgi:hypothetical protein
LEGWEGDEKILRRIPWEILGLSGALSLGAVLLFGAFTGLFVLLGGMTAALGFSWLRHSVTKLLMSGRRRAVRTAVLLYGLRLVLILAFFFIIILFFSAHIYAFIFGFSTVIPAFLVEAVAALSRLKPWKS